MQVSRFFSALALCAVCLTSVAHAQDQTSDNARRLLEALINGLNERNQDNGTVATNPEQTGSTGTTQPAETTPATRRDRTPPRIQVEHPRPESEKLPVINSKRRKVTLRVIITDDSDKIRFALAKQKGERIVLNSNPETPRLYTAALDMPRDFEDEVVEIVAVDWAGNRGSAAVILRLDPWCGVRKVVFKKTILAIQESLLCAGIDAGAVDGALGPNTCRAIEKFLEDSSPQFIHGKMSWGEVLDRSKLACNQNRSAKLDFKSPVTRDTTTMQVTVRLLNPGSATTVNIYARNQLVMGRNIQNSRAVFELEMPPPGQVRDFEVKALNRLGFVLDSSPLQLRRPAIKLDIDTNNTIVSKESSVTLTANISSGAASVAAIGLDQLPSGVNKVTYARQPLKIQLIMPEPGNQAVISLWAIDRSNLLYDKQFIKLVRPAIELPLVLEVTPDVVSLDAPEAQIAVRLTNPGATETLAVVRTSDGVVLHETSALSGNWLPVITMPEAGETHELVVQARTSRNQVLASQNIKLVRPNVIIQPVDQTEPGPDYDEIPVTTLALAGLGLVLLTGMIRSVFQRRTAKTPQPALSPTLRIYATPDELPQTELLPLNLPVMTIIIEPDQQPEALVTFEDSPQPDDGPRYE